MRRPILLLLLPVLLGACVQSVHPLYTEQSLTAEPALVGTWLDAGRASLVVAERDSVSYDVLSLGDDLTPSSWILHLTTLGEGRWLDAEPAPERDWSEAYADAMLPLHQFLLLRAVGDSLHVATLKHDSLKATLEREPSLAAHTIVNGTVVLTASTDQLRAFLASYVRRPGVLDEADPLTRAR